MEKSRRSPSATPSAAVMLLPLIFFTLTTGHGITMGPSVHRVRRQNDDTAATRLFYNPPAGNSPPHDILEMLEKGTNFGNPNFFTSRSFVKETRNSPENTHINASNKQVDSTSVESFTSPKQNVTLNESQSMEVQSDVESIPDLETTTILVEQTSTTEDRGNIFDSTTGIPEQTDSLIDLDFTRFDISTLPPYGTNITWDHTTNNDNIITMETTIIPTDNHEARDDLSELELDNDWVQDTTRQTELPEEEGVWSTQNTVQLMTSREDEIKKTTIFTTLEDSETVTATESDEKTPDPSQTLTVEVKTDAIYQSATAEVEKEAINISIPQSSISGYEEDDLRLGNIELLRLNALNEYSQKITDGKVSLDNLIANNYLTKGNEEEIYSAEEVNDKIEALTGSKLNTIFFTIEDEKDGQVRVKVGKSLNFPSNKNSIHKNENYKDNVYQYHFQDPATGWYKFGYGSDNQWRHEERREDGIVLGRYGWHDATGKEHTTHFVADAKGYRLVQPGEEIVMHVPTPSPPRRQAVNPVPTTLTTVQPTLTGKPSIPPAPPTTAAFPLASLSTTVTFSTQSLPTGPPGQVSVNHQSSVPPADSYPGTIDELVQPPSDPSVVTGRPPIAYPLPHPSVSHRPGTWVYVTPASSTPQTTRPISRPPYKPFRPYPHRPITSPFRPVNRPRPKPLRPRPLKPLQPHLHKGSRPHYDSEEEEEEEEEVEEDLFSGNTSGENNNNPINNDLIGVLQTLLSNPSKYPLVHSPLPQSVDENYIPNYPVPSNIPSTSGQDMEAASSDSQNPSSMSPNDLLHFINLINSLKGQGPATATSPDRPGWSLSPWSSSAIKFPSQDGPSMPSPVLRPPPSQLSSSPTTVHEVFQGNHPHYPLDYAFIDEDYMWPELGASFPNKGVQIKPAGGNLNLEGFPIIKPPPAPSTTYVNQETAKPAVIGKPIKNKDPSSSDYVGSVVWKLPVLGPLEVETPQVAGIQEGIETDKGIIKIAVNKTGVNSPGNIEVINFEDIKPQNMADVSSTTVIATLPISVSTSSSISTSALTSILTPSSSAMMSESDPPPTESIWPYITQSSTASTPASNQTTILPSPPPPQNFWTELLKRIYHWPMIGKERPTLQ